MAEWVLKGSLKGPQGDPGPEPDVSSLLGTDSSGRIVRGGEVVKSLSLNYESEVGVTPDVGVSLYSANGLGSSVTAYGPDGLIALEAKSGRLGISVGRSSALMPSLYEVSDEISEGDKTIATGRAVMDYVAANAPSVTLPLPVSQGGTGATTAEGALVSLGISVADPDELVEYVKQHMS